MASAPTERRQIRETQQGGRDATVAATLRFHSGGLAQFAASFGAADLDNYRVVGTLGDLELDPGFRFETATKLRLGRNGKIIETPFAQIDHFGAQVAYFSDCIATDCD
jgi:predicted dehydrogenase